MTEANLQTEWAALLFKSLRDGAVFNRMQIFYMGCARLQ